MLPEENIRGKTEADHYFLEFARNGLKFCNGPVNKDFEEIVPLYNTVNMAGY